MTKVIARVRSPGSFDECRLSAGWPPILRPSQSTWAVSPPTIIRNHFVTHACAISDLRLLFQPHNTAAGWRRGVVFSGVRRMNEVNLRRARLVPGWMTVFGQVCHLGM